MEERNLLFGTDSAESDTELKRYFIETGTYRAVENKEKIIVVGRKGSGKSAIFNCLTSGDTIYIKLSPNKYALDYFHKFMSNKENADFCNLTSFTGLWKYLILKEITRQLKEGTDNNLMTCTNIGQESVSILDSWIKSNVNINTIEEFVSNTNNSNKLLESEEIDLKLINSILIDKPIHVLVDDLDFVWENNIWSLNYIQGLIECAYDLCNTYTKKIFATLFIREDIFSILETKFHRIDNIRNQIETITWFPKLLRQMIARRIQRYYELTPIKYNRDYWYYSMPDTVNEIDSFKYMIERTQLRPRELIQFCTKAYEISTRYKKNRIESKDVNEAEAIYSEWKLKDLCSEYITQYEGLMSLFRGFSVGKFLLSKQEIVEIIEEKISGEEIIKVANGKPQKLQKTELLQFLYDCGFIRARIIDPSTRKKIYRSSSTYKNLNLSTVDYFDIHPAYRRAILG